VASAAIKCEEGSHSAHSPPSSLQITADYQNLSPSSRAAGGGFSRAAAGEAAQAGRLTLQQHLAASRSATSAVLGSLNALQLELPRSLAELHARLTSSSVDDDACNLEVRLAVHLTDSHACIHAAICMLLHAACCMLL